MKDSDLLLSERTESEKFEFSWNLLFFLDQFSDEGTYPQVGSIGKLVNNALNRLKAKWLDRYT